MFLLKVMKGRFRIMYPLTFFIIYIAWALFWTWIFHIQEKPEQSFSYKIQFIFYLKCKSLKFFMVRGNNSELDQDRQCKIAKKNVVHYKVYFIYIYDLFMMLSNQEWAGYINVLQIWFQWKNLQIYSSKGLKYAYN